MSHARLASLVVLAAASLGVPAARAQSVSPVLECVQTLGGGQYRAFYGTNNATGAAVTVPVGSKNRFNVAPDDRGQPTTFAPGRTVGGTAVDFSGAGITWLLTNRSATASPTSTPCKASDLELTGTASPAAPAVGDVVAVTFSLVNRGPDANPGVVTRVTGLDKLDVVSFEASRDGTDPAAGIWKVGTLGKDSTATLTVRIRVSSAGPVRITAEVIETGRLDPDSTPGNGVASEDDQATVAFAAAACRVATVADYRAAGSFVKENYAEIAAPAWACPAEVSLTSYELPGGSIRPFDEQRAFASETTTVGPGVTATKVELPACSWQTALYLGPIVKELDARDGHPAERLIATDALEGTPCDGKTVDVSLALAASDPAPRVGDVVRFTLRLANDGAADATGVVVTDRLPDGLAFVAFDGKANAGTNGQEITWKADAVPAGRRVEIAYDVRVTRAGTFENVAFVAAQNEPDADSRPGDTDPTQDDYASATVTTIGSSGGGGAGVESDGALATRLANRLFARRADVQARAALLAAPAPVPFQSATAGATLGGPRVDGTRGDGLRLSESGSASLSLGALVPADGPLGTRAFETTPGDLLGVTNARAVVAADYLRPDGRRLAALFAATSPEGVLYDHAKATCDRLGGGRLDAVERLVVDGRTFVMQRLVHADGAVDHAVSFVAIAEAGGVVIDSQFARDEYRLPAGAGEVVNVQVWSVSPEATAGLVRGVLARLAAVGTVRSLSADAPALPSAYVVDGRYENGRLALRLAGRTGRVTVSGTASRTEGDAARGIRTPFERTVDVAATPDGSPARVTLDVGPLFDASFTVQLDGTPGLDQLYYADGTWSHATGKATVERFETRADTAPAPADGSVRVERSARLSGRVTDFASLFRYLRAAGAPVDLARFTHVEFTARGTGRVQVVMEKASVTTWDQYATTITLTDAPRPVRIAFADLRRSGGAAGLDARDVTLVAFYALGTGADAPFDIEVSDLRFTSGTVSAAGDAPTAIADLALGQSAPNPVRSGTATIPFALARAEHARLDVFDLTGRRVATLVDAALAAGRHTATLEADGLPAGVYLYRLTTPSGARTGRTTVVR